jgi:adenylosuccinate lyase
MSAWEQGKPFRSLLEADSRVTLSAEQLDDAFDLTRSLRNIDRTFHALEEVETG